MIILRICSLLAVVAASNQWLSGDEPVWLTKPEAIVVPEGFRVELVYAVPFESQGSWVSMTVDPQGRLITSDQYGKLYRLTPSTGEPKVEVIDVELGGAQGLLCAFDSLYAMVNEQQPTGMYRIWDSDGDDVYDSKELILPISGSGEHGPHAIVRRPDDNWLYVCAGNHTDFPKIDQSYVPQVWDEDHLLPRFMDPRGHAAGIKAPGGWVCRVTKDGSRCELLTVGFRNQYDIAFNHDGELFTFDADMEWDLGSPWYRPTRVNHVIQGVDFGWRSGSSKWPEYYVDSLPAAVNIGPGSPTGITFAYGAKFPTRYQQALFVADWSQGRLIAVFLEAQGASYRGNWELFASAPALPITDMVVNPSDGALYFAIGGRKTQSAVYRIVHEEAQTTGAVTGSEEGKPARAIRRQLEQLQQPGVSSQELDKVWDALAHEDRVIRSAARVALEHQPIHTWKDRLQQANFVNASQRLSATLALTRLGHRNDLSLVIDQIDSLELHELTLEDQLDWLRVLQLAFIRLGPPEAQRDRVLKQLNRVMDTDDVLVQREVATLLVYLRSDGLAERLFDWIDASRDQHQRIHLLMVLRMLANEFNPTQTVKFFDLLKQARLGGGGKSYGGYIDQIADDAFARMSDHNQACVSEVLAEIRKSNYVDLAVDRPFVKAWTVEELLTVVDPTDESHDIEIGRQLFAEVQCIACHRAGGTGGITGPDLSHIGSRMTTRDLLMAIVQPDLEISSQYLNHRFEMENGTTATGRIINLSENTWHVNPDMRNPGSLIRIDRRDVERVSPSKTSTMPSGLLDTLSVDEIGTLLAFLKSAK